MVIKVASRQPQAAAALVGIADLVAPSPSNQGVIKWGNRKAECPETAASGSQKTKSPR